MGTILAVLLVGIVVPHIYMELCLKLKRPCFHNLRPKYLVKCSVLFYTSYYSYDFGIGC